ncbi:MAG: homing endonuclease associated repeat-containing protein, partial [bacterium]
NFSASTFHTKFGSWFNALRIAELKKTTNLGVSDEEYFKNLESVWVKLGRQPKYKEMQKPLSEYCAGAYEYRFGTWRKALKEFIKYINSEEIPELENKEPVSINKSQISKQTVSKHKTSRSISWRLRFIIMRRDNFKCKICGRSPATQPDITLQVDHIRPWSDGGETAPENLQTLCDECNIGKSNLKL